MEDTLGHIKVIPLQNPDRINFEPNKHRSWLEKTILRSLAGYAAEFILTGRHYWKGSELDVLSAYDKADLLTYDPDESKRYIEWLFSRTVNLLRTPWHCRAV